MLACPLAIVITRVQYKRTSNLPATQRGFRGRPTAGRPNHADGKVAFAEVNQTTLMDNDDCLRGLGLAPLTLETKPTFDACLQAVPKRISDYSFANTYIWRHHVRLGWRLIRDCLCIFANGQGLSMLLPPIGPGDVRAAAAEAMEICRAACAANDWDVPPYIEYATDEALATLAPDFSAEPMSGDYVYLTCRMIDLDGGDLSSKRQARNRFARRYDARCEDFRPDHESECLRMLAVWHRQHEETDTPGGELIHTRRGKETAAAAEAVCNAEALGLRGMVLFAGETLVGFTLGERIAPETCSILIEKTDREYAGSAQYIYSEFCRRYWADTTYTNAGDDWDAPTLAWTKESYRPVARYNKWRLFPIARSIMVVPPSTPPEERLATLADLDDLLALERRNFCEKDAFRRRQLRYLLQSPCSRTLTVRRDGRLAAAATMLWRRTTRGLTGRIYSLSVDSEFRGQGLGRRLLQRCVEELTALGARAVVLEVRIENSPAVELYRAQGFICVEQLDDYYAPGEHGLKMRLDLTPVPT